MHTDYAYTKPQNRYIHYDVMKKLKVVQLLAIIIMVTDEMIEGDFYGLMMIIALY